MMPRRALKLGQKNIFAKNSVCFLFRRFASKQTPKDDIKNAPKVEKNFENLAKRTDNVQKTAETIKKDGENESYIPIKEPEDGTGNYAYWAKGENLKKEGTTKVIRNAGFYFMLAVIVYYTISKVNEKKKFTAISNAEVMVLSLTRIILVLCNFGAKGF